MEVYSGRTGPVTAPVEDPPLDPGTFEAVLGVLARCVPRDRRKRLADSFPGAVDEFALISGSVECCDLAGLHAEVAASLHTTPARARAVATAVVAELRVTHPEFVAAVSRRLGTQLC